MHYLPDTEDEDSAAEKFWPEGYKSIIREEIPPRVSAQLQGEPRFEKIYEERFSDKYFDAGDFLSRLGAMVAVGAENGADDVFNDIMDSFLYELPLPDIRRYAHYLWPEVLTEDITERLRQVILDEYSVDGIYTNAYSVGYADRYPSFDEYIDWVSQIVVVGTKNGANEALGKIYRSLSMHTPLTPARRRPRRLRTW
jgi:hypothetical protein